MMATIYGRKHRIRRGYPLVPPNDNADMEQNPRTKASDRIVFSTGEIMTLGEALDLGRVVVGQRTDYSRKKEDSAGRALKVTHYYAKSVTGDEFWDIGEKLYLSRSGKPGHTPNPAAVHYVWLIDYRGVPMDSEGPYGPMSLARAEAFARIGAKEGDHDRVVSIGSDVMSDGFEILRRYRRGTGERTQ